MVSVENAANRISVRLNGGELEIPLGCTVAQLLVLAEVVNPLIAVEVNGTLVPKSEHDQHALQADDQIEIVTLVGGG